MKKQIAIILILLLAFTLVACGGSSEEPATEEEPTVASEEAVEEPEEDVVEEPFDPAECVSISYEELMRSPDEYEGQKIKLTGDVYQIFDSEDGFVDGLLAVDEYWEDLVSIYYDSSITSQRVLEDDRVTMYGIYEGIETYESTGEGMKSVPLLYVRHIEFH